MQLVLIAGLLRLLKYVVTIGIGDMPLTLV